MRVKQDAAPAPDERWTAAREKAFLAELARSSDVTVALAAAGLTHDAVRARRRARPDFARSWDRALAEGVIDELTAMLARVRSDRSMGEATRLQVIAAIERRIAAYRDDPEVRRMDTGALRRQIRDKLDRLARSLGHEVTR